MVEIIKMSVLLFFTDVGQVMVEDVTCIVFSFIYMGQAM